jgi:hypothetical protein
MKTLARIVLLLTASGSVLLGADRTNEIGPLVSPNRDLTLIANPAAFLPSAADLAKIKARDLEAERQAAVARVAAIGARIRQIREESEARIEQLRGERDALVQREKEISESLRNARP